MHRPWGEFKTENETNSSPNEEEMRFYYEKVQEMKIKRLKVNYPKNEDLKVATKNPILTQSLEVLNQTDMIRTLIDTYSNKTGYNYVFNPCQVIPKLESQIPGNDTNLAMDKRFSKPLWFINPIETNFTKGQPEVLPRITKPIVKKLLRKSLCGLLRMHDYNESEESALSTFVDAIDEFYKIFMDNIQTVLINQSKERENEIDVMSLEKAYFSMNQTSLLTLHNYFNNDMIQKNQTHIAEFRNAFQDYDKLMQESQKSIREEERMSTSYYDKYSNQSSFVNSQEDDLPLNVLHVYDGTENAG